MIYDAAIAAQVCELIRASLGEATLQLGFDHDLLGMLDSLQVLRIVTDLEAFFAIRVENCEMTPEHLGSIAKLAAYVQSKR